MDDICFIPFRRQEHEVRPMLAEIIRQAKPPAIRVGATTELEPEPEIQMQMDQIPEPEPEMGSRLQRSRDGRPFSFDGSAALTRQVAAAYDDAGWFCSEYV